MQRYDDIGPEGCAVLEAEAARLTDWLDGICVVNVYSSPQMKGATLP